MPSLFPPLRAIVFDMDGTLYRNARLNQAYDRSVDRVVAEAQGVSLAEARRRFLAAYDRLRRRLGRTPSKLYTLTQLGISDRDWARRAGRWIKPHLYLKPNPRLRRTLLALRPHFKLAVVTNNHRRNLVSTLRALGVDDCFDDLLALSDTRLFKPSRRLYQVSAERLGVDPADCLSVGDRYELDLAPAAQAGMQTLLVQRLADLYRLPQLVRPAGGTWRPTRTPGQRRQAAAAATASLRAGRLVIMPTDTVYGLASLPKPEAVRWLFRAKGRSEANPLVLLLADPGSAGRYARLNGQARELARRYWPGPLTLVLPAKPGTAWPRLTHSSRTVALRVPAHSLAREIIRRCGGVLAVTSANLSGQPAPFKSRDISSQIRVFSDCQVSGDAGLEAQPSAVVKVTGQKLLVLRPGRLKLGQNQEKAATKRTRRGSTP
jgi:L-threonylcarbamoyladenylate synthase